MWLLGSDPIWSNPRAAKPGSVSNLRGIHFFKNPNWFNAEDKEVGEGGTKVEF